MRVTKGGVAEGLILLAVPTLSYFLVDHAESLRAGLQSLLEGKRGTLYPALVGLQGSLLGFTIASLTIIVGYSTNPRLDSVRQTDRWDQLFNNFTRAARWCGFGTILAVLAVIIDRDDAPNLLFSVLLFFGLIATAWTVGRMVWLLQLVVKAATKNKTRRPGH